MGLGVGLKNAAAFSSGGGGKAGGPRNMSASVEVRGGVAYRPPLAEDQEIAEGASQLKANWPILGGFRASLISFRQSKAFGDLRLYLDYDSSMMWRVEEKDPTGNVAQKHSRFQTITVGVMPRWTGRWANSGWAIAPSLGYRGRTWFSTVQSSIPNHGRHGVYGALNLAWSDKKGLFEATVRPQFEWLMPDKALRNKSDGSARWAAGLLLAARVWVKGPYAIGARYGELWGLGETEFRERVVQLTLGFIPVRLSKTR